MSDGVYRIKDEHISTLNRLYTFEATRVAGPGSQFKAIQDTCWTREEASAALLEEDRAVLDDLLEDMRQQHQLLVIPEDGGAPEKYATRTGELVRRLGHGYEYWHRGRPTIMATEWLVESKKIPDRCRTPNNMITRLNEAVGSVLQPEARAKAWAGPIERAVEATVSFISSKGGFPKDDVRFSDFQIEATRDILLDRIAARESVALPRTKARAQVLVAGVGSGKTIGFTLVALIESLWANKRFASEKNRGCVLFVYPRTELAKNQFADLSSMCSNNCVQGVAAWFEHHTSYREANLSVASGLPQKYPEHSGPSNLIVTTFETLKRRMRRREFLDSLRRNLHTVVVDEVHLLSGVGGAMASQLLRRLAHLNSEAEVHFIGASATIARPDEHAAALFGVLPSQVRSVLPSDEEMKPLGLNHHVFLRPAPGMSTLGALVNTTSLAVHGRRDDIGANRELVPDKRLKAIGFADNLDMLGRWRDDLQENERRQKFLNKSKTTDRPSTEGSDPATWKRQEDREIPYIWRYHTPLERRIRHHGGTADDEAELLGDLTHFDDGKGSPCQRCKNGERVGLGSATEEEMREFGKLVHRDPFLQSDEMKAFHLKHAVFTAPCEDLGTLDRCPYLKAGACDWFSANDFSKLDHVIHWKGDKNGWHTQSEGLRTRIVSSKTSTSSEEGETISESIFMATDRDIHDINSWESGKESAIKQLPKKPLDMVLASPSLEVGVDIPRLTESVMIKSVRNIAAYRQKAGRVGRETGMDALNVSILTESPLDLHYYRQPRKLVADGRLEPVPLVDRNLAVLRSSVYTAIWEWLALHSQLPESLSSGDTNVLTPGLMDASHTLDQRRLELIEFLNATTGEVLQYVDPEQELVQMAIEQVKTEINLLLLPVRRTLTLNPDISGREPVAFDALLRQLSNKGDVVLSDTEGLIERSVEHRNKVVETLNALLRRLRATSEVWLNSDPSLFDDASEMLQRAILFEIESGSINTLTSRLERYLDEDDDEDHMVDLERGAKRLERALTALEEIEFDVRVYQLFQDYKQNLCTPKQGSDDVPWERWYLSDTMEHLSLLTHHRHDWFVRPKNLYENPYKKRVELTQVNRDGREFIDEKIDSPISIDEALHSFLPGTWTQRVGELRLKTKVGRLEARAGHLAARLEQIEAAGSSFHLVDRNPMPPAPGFSRPMRIFAPSKVVIMSIKNDKYVSLDRRTARIVDRDEQTGFNDEEGDPTKKRVKVPKSNHNRWIWGPSDNDAQTQSKPVGALKLPGFNYIGPGRITLDPEEVEHPLQECHIAGVTFHEQLDVTEFTHSVTRAYGGAGEVDLRYYDRFDNCIGFGERITTSGLEFEFHEEHLNAVILAACQNLHAGAHGMSASLILALKAQTSLDDVGVELSAYTIDDAVAITLRHAEWDGTHVSAASLEAWFRAAIEDEEGFRSIGAHHYTIRMQMEDEEGLSEDDQTLLNNKIEAAFEAAKVLHRLSETLEDELPTWIRRTVMSTFGCIARSALKQFTGGDDRDIGYYIPQTAWEGGRPSIVLFDRSQYGNGSCKTGASYLHIPHVTRQAAEMMAIDSLPTSDLLSMIEERLLQCMQKQSDTAALRVHQDGEGALATLPDLKQHAVETHRVAGRTWGVLGITGATDAWKMPVHRRILTGHAQSFPELHVDEILRSTTTCWNGCPECTGGIADVLGGFRGLNFIDKHLLDEWFRLGAASSESYSMCSLEDIATGDSTLNLGILNDVRATNDNGTELRSIGLPWTMGLDLNHEEGGATRLVLRNTDIGQRKIGGGAGPGTGIAGHAMRRLLWFNLLMTAHLKATGRLEASEGSVSTPPRIDLIYYDARNIRFEDLGLSPRMTDSLRDDFGAGSIENLSDVLRWLLNHGIRVRLGIDRQRLDEDGVRDLITSVGAHPDFEVYTQLPGRANMHIKSLVSPVGALTGSGNLTPSAVGEQGRFRNDEHLTYAGLEHGGPYERLRVEVDEAFERMDLLDPNSIAPPEARWSDSGRRGAARPRPTTVIVSPPQGAHQHQAPTFKDKTEQMIHEMITGDRPFVEDLMTEFKDYEKIDKMEYDWIAKEVAGMLNARGGQVIFGVKDKSSEVRGIGPMIEWLKEKKARDPKFGGDPLEYLRMKLADEVGKNRLGDKGLFSGSVQVKFYFVKDRTFLVLDVEMYTGDEPIEVKPVSDEDMKRQAGKDGGTVVYERREEQTEPISTRAEYTRFLKRWGNRPAR